MNGIIKKVLGRDKDDLIIAEKKKMWGEMKTVTRRIKRLNNAIINSELIMTVMAGAVIKNKHNKY